MSEKIRRFPYFATIILTGLITRLVFSGLSVWGVAGLVVTVLWFAIEIVRWLLPPGGRRKSSPSEKPGSRIPVPSEEAPLVSLVFFLSEPRHFDESAIRSCVANALGIRFRVNDADSDTFVIPFSPPDSRKDGDHIRHFMVRIPDGLFAVLLSDRPYIENPKDFARGSIRDKRLRSAVERHVAWVSVDLMDEPPDSRTKDLSYQVIGKILASMGGPDCLAIYCPELQRCNEFDPGLLESLTGEFPLELFDEPTFEPVIEISDNNPKMTAAVRQAVVRWPEFVAAFAESDSSERERYIVKAEFREGKKSEFMWVSVRELGEETVSGILMNDPHELLECHRGAAVSFTLDRLNDWIYPGRGGSHIGGFTLDVLADDGED